MKKLILTLLPLLMLAVFSSGCSSKRDYTFEVPYNWQIVKDAREEVVLERIGQYAKIVMKRTNETYDKFDISQSLKEFFVYQANVAGWIGIAGSDDIIDGRKAAMISYAVPGYEDTLNTLYWIEHPKGRVFWVDCFSESNDEESLGEIYKIVLSIKFEG